MILGSEWTSILYFDRSVFSLMAIWKEIKSDIEPLVSQILVKKRLISAECPGLATDHSDFHKLNLLDTSSGQCSHDPEHRVPRYRRIVSMSTRFKRLEV